MWSLLVFFLVMKILQLCQKTFNYVKKNSCNIEKVHKENDVREVLFHHFSKGNLEKLARDIKGCLKKSSVFSLQFVNQVVLLR